MNTHFQPLDLDSAAELQLQAKNEETYGDKKIVRLMWSYLFIGTAVPTAVGMLYMMWAYAGVA